MKNALFILATLLLTFTSCNEATDQYNLSGKIDGLSNQEITLEFITFNEVTAIDTAQTDENGNYEFIGKTSEPGFYRISGQGKFWMLRLENEEVVYNASFDDDLLDKVEVLKSEKAQKFQEVVKYFIDKQTELSSFGTQYQTKQMAGASMEELMAIEAAYMEAQEGMNAEIKTRIEASTDPIASIYLLSALQSPEDKDYVKGKLNDFSEILPNSTLIQQMKAQIANAEMAQAEQDAMMAAQAEASKKVDLGAVAPDFTQKNPKGVDVSLSSLKGKVVLLDFWASWCKPCRYENPNVVAAYNAYKDKGFTVLSVSLDKEREAWMSAIAQDGLVWPYHVSDLQFWNNAAAKLYGVQSIPAAFLIDADGIIIGRDLRGPALEEKLKEVLG